MRKLIIALCACLVSAAVLAGTAAARHGSKRAKHSNAVSGLDKQSLQTSMAGDLFEVQGGELALKRSHQKAVRALAKRLIKDHSKSYSDAVKIANKLGIEVEHHPLPTQIWELRSVAAHRGHRFNLWYTSLEVYDHRQDITETTDEVRDGTNREVVSDARQELPMLREHLRLAKHAFASVKKN